MNRPVILCFVGYYLPGYRSGGPVRTIANVVDQLGDEFDIRIVTSDRDVQDINAYPDVSLDAWNTVGKARVFYASRKTTNLLGIARLLRETSHNLLYLNSFFSFVFTGLPLLARRLGIAPCSPCLIAPRGEFSAGALALKDVKKRIYIRLIKASKIYQNLHWQASSNYEKADIMRNIGFIAHRVHVAPDLTPALPKKLNTNPARSSKLFQLIFLSRISPMKNLDFILRALAKVSANVVFAIYGPKEDELYWKECKFLIDQLPNNINVKISNQVPQEQVCGVFAAHDLFVFPTRGENFGHVIFESLSSGTPVLVSDQTPWQRDVRGALSILPLDEQQWADAITAWTKLDHEVLFQRRQAAVEYALSYAADNHPVEQNRQLFRSALGES